MTARWYFVSAVALGMMALSGPGAAQQANTKAGSLEQTARSFIDLLDKGEFAKATNDFDAAMLKALPQDELKKTWQKVLDDAGAYQKQVRQPARDFRQI